MLVKLFRHGIFNKMSSNDRHIDSIIQAWINGRSKVNNTKVSRASAQHVGRRIIRLLSPLFHIGGKNFFCFAITFSRFVIAPSTDIAKPFFCAKHVFLLRIITIYFARSRRLSFARCSHCTSRSFGTSRSTRRIENSRQISAADSRKTSSP